jgi:hypothetical protein
VGTHCIPLLGHEWRQKGGFNGGKKYILHGMIEQGRKNDFLAIEHMTSKCHLSTFMRSMQTEWIEAGQMKEDPNYEELVKNYIEKHLWAMSNLTK